MINLCCDKIREEIKKENMTINRERKVFIYGRPKFVDDGDGYSDDMTPEIKIEFCPFCGTKLKN